MVYPAKASIRWPCCRRFEDERCAALYGVPTMFIAVLDHPDFAKFDVSSLRTGIMAGSPCPIEVMKRVIDKLHMGEVTIAYGMTETSPVSFQSGFDDSIERRVSTVGRVQPHCEVKIVDGAGKTVARGVAGELCTRGYSVMHGYWDDPARTVEAVDKDGWMHTGDLGVIDDEGYCNIVGRIKDMVIRGGENVYPREIEEFLYRHPENPRCAGGRPARHEIWRGALRLDHSARRRGHDGGRRARLLRGPDRPLQDPALYQIRRRLPDDSDGQDPEIPHPQADEGRAGPERPKTA